MSLPPDADRTEIVREGTGYLLRIGGADQSFVNLDDPTHLEFDYVQRMADVIDLLGEPGEPMRFVHVGGAGLTLPRYVTHTRPTSAQIVLEPAEHITARVREELPLPRRSGIKVRALDGAAGLAAMPDTYADVIVLDAYDGPQVPAHLVTRDFFADVARVMAAHGTVLINLGDTAPFTWSRRVLAGLRLVLPELMVSAEPATLKGRRFGNLLVVASRHEVPSAALRRRAAGSPFPYSVLGPAEVASRLAGGTPFTADDTEPSPAPPNGRTSF
ncbi:MAG: fused MFS/spermidine synthase [Aeromicrobium sp.]